MRHSFKFTMTEDELNFILGNDVGQLFDIDIADTLVQAVPPPLPNDSVSAHMTDSHDERNSSLSSLAKPSLPTFTVADYELMNDDFVSRIESSTSPAPDQESSPAVECDSNPLLAKNDLNAVPEDQDFKFDITDDLLFPQNLSSSCGIMSDILLSISRNSFVYSKCKPSAHLCPNPQNRYKPSFSPKGHSATSASAAATTNKTRAHLSHSFPSIAHPSHLTTAPKSLTRKRGVDQDPTAAVNTKADKARLARRKRRCLRARSQAINLAGGGNISRIRHHAVEGANYAWCSTPSERANLLAEFLRSFDPKMYVDLTFEQVYMTMVEGSNTNEAARVADVPSDAESGANNPSLSPNHQPLQAPSANAPPRSSAAIQVIAPHNRAENSLKDLPSGKDPQSRRLRTLMRNRLSAQKSRDRRKRAIENARMLKEEKEEEIKALEKALSKELHQMMLLENVVGYARGYLGHDSYSRVASAVDDGTNVIQSN